MRLKMIGFAGVSLLLLAGCDSKPKPQADAGCVQKPVCAAPAQPPAPAATTPPPSYEAPPRPRRTVRYAGRRWSGGYSRSSYSGGSYRYEGEVKDYGQVYSAGDTRYAGTRVQVQTSDTYVAGGQTSTSYSSYGGGSVYVSGGPAGCPGPCGPARVRAAGRDRNGYLTWPSK